MTFEPEHAGAILKYLGVMALNIALLAAFFYRYRTKYLPYILGFCLYAMLAVLCAILIAPDLFEVPNLGCYGVFICGPVLLAISQYTARKGGRPRIANLFTSMALLLVAIGIDAFLVEPHWLEVTHRTVTTEKLKKPVKIAVIADIQTDSVGQYEREILDIVRNEKPDLILFAGDYIQTLTPALKQKEMAKLNAVLKQVNLQAPLGLFAVDGNQEEKGWQSVFQDLPITTIDKYKTIPLEGQGGTTGDHIILIGLGFLESHDPSMKISPQNPNDLVIVMGHCPDFALNHPPADLLLAGHTHGGQVCLPGLGPLLTGSHVPRAWASGLSHIDSRATLLVSRGVGMERWYAPRIRFLCRPELTFITLEPAK
ncbi:MAG: metallophosphoesterase [Cyanobacteria bacterium SZAS LIN-3]|nr:metallophosphoesterase [Cyanobacteria bacterium SZAS LIN-3]